jgi:uncharacterized lipoprotein NlpE involved in copper resistance
MQEPIGMALKFAMHLPLGCQNRASQFSSLQQAFLQASGPASTGVLSSCAEAQPRANSAKTKGSGTKIQAKLQVKMHGFS